MCFRCGRILHQEQGCIGTALGTNQRGRLESQFCMWLRPSLSTHKTLEVGKKRLEDEQNMGDDSDQ